METIAASILTTELGRFKTALADVISGKEDIFIYGDGSNGKSFLMKCLHSNGGWTHPYTGSIDTWTHTSGRSVFISNNLDDLNCLGKKHVFKFGQKFNNSLIQPPTDINEWLKTC